MHKRWSITARSTSAPFGEYEGATPDAALRALYADAGEEYPGEAEALETWDVEPVERARLAQLIADSGLSAAAFARLVLGRDERTVRRWQSGETEIPDSAAEWLERASVASDAVSVVVTVRR